MIEFTRPHLVLLSSFSLPLLLQPAVLPFSLTPYIITIGTAPLPHTYNYIINYRHCLLTTAFAVCCAARLWLSASWISSRSPPSCCKKHDLKYLNEHDLKIPEMSGYLELCHGKLTPSRSLCQMHDICFVCVSTDVICFCQNSE